MGQGPARGSRGFGETAAMNQMEALQRIRELGVQSFETRDVSALLRISPANASVLLSRLGSRGHVQRISRGRWSIGGRSERERLAEELAAPAPAYVSLQSALYRHGLLDQIPDVIYAVTLGRARLVRSPLGTVSFHRMPPALFGGFETDGSGAKMATAEKALFDFAYLGPTRSRHFTSLPEMEFPRGFRWKELEFWADKIAGKSRQIHVRRKLLALRQSRSRIQMEKR
jgi:predicted transcriptional regulator of viral defense system